MVDTVYDATGRVQSTSNPYRSAGDPTYGLESSLYDGLNRVTRITHHDTQFSQMLYGAGVTGAGGIASQLCGSSTYGFGYPLLSVDEAGKKRQVWVDGFGRTIEVDEPDAGNNLTLNTCYKYDLLDNLKEVNQGTQTRLYTYDGLSRIVTSDSAEETPGLTNLYYTTSGGALCSGAPEAVCRRTDARAITTTYAYDALNRLISVTYSDSTPARSFFYDQTSYNGLTITNGKGRRTGMSDGSGTTAWSYDAAGRVLTERRTISGVTKNTSYTYNLAGNVLNVTYPSGRVITYTYSTIGRPLTAKDIANNINYVTDALYAPPGGLSSLKNGIVSGGFAGITRTNGYNNRLQVNLLSAAAPGGTVFSLSYGFGASNNGQIASIANNLNNNRTQNFTYDTLRRLLTAQSQANSGGDCWGQSYTYDRWANKPTDTVTKCSAPPLSVAISSATNRITSTGFAYDNAGDLTNENGPTYTWNAEQQITAAGGVTYTYDADGLRVKKSNGKIYWRGTGVDALAETDLAGNNPVEFIYFAGLRVAMRDTAGGVYFIFTDQVGSTRAVTDANGVVCRDMDFFPFGGEKITLNTCPALTYKFATYERDAETGLDYAIFRYYNSRLGRFMSPDALAGETGDPQSLNRYAYALNDPVNRYDPLGLDWIWGWGWGGAWDPVGGVMGGPVGAFGILPGDLVIPPPRSIEELLKDLFIPELGECSNPGATFLPDCVGAMSGFPVFGFDGRRPFEALGDQFNVTPLDKCRTNVEREFSDAKNWEITPLGEGLRKAAEHIGVDVGIETLPMPWWAKIAASAANFANAVKEIHGKVKKAWKKDRARRAKLDLCEAAFGSPE